jgi:hypothetical protein
MTCVNLAMSKCLCTLLNGLLKAVDQIKGKASPLQAWTGPEGSRRLGLPDSKTIGT